MKGLKPILRQVLPAPWSTFLKHENMMGVTWASCKGALAIGKQNQHFYARISVSSRIFLRNKYVQCTRSQFCTTLDVTPGKWNLISWLLLSYIQTEWVKQRSDIMMSWYSWKIALLTFVFHHIIKYLNRARVGWPTGNPLSHFLKPQIVTANTTITAPTTLKHKCVHLKTCNITGMHQNKPYLPYCIWERM